MRSNVHTPTRTYALNPPYRSGRVKRRRPHVIKIDAEGHDYEVLSSFVLDENIPRADLPLLVDFEAKSIKKHFDKAKATMESLSVLLCAYVCVCIVCDCIVDVDCRLRESMFPRRLFFVAASVVVNTVVMSSLTLTTTVLPS